MSVGVRRSVYTDTYMRHPGMVGFRLVKGWDYGSTSNDGDPQASVETRVPGSIGWRGQLRRDVEPFEPMGCMVRRKGEPPLFAGDDDAKAPRGRLCACGCGEPVNTVNATWVPGHWWRDPTWRAEHAAIEARRKELPQPTSGQWEYVPPEEREPLSDDDALEALAAWSEQIGKGRARESAMEWEEESLVYLLQLLCKNTGDVSLGGDIIPRQTVVDLRDIWLRVMGVQPFGTVMPVLPNFLPGKVSELPSERTKNPAADNVL